MARRGRKRKQGYRKPSGDLIVTQIEKQESAQIIAMRQPHRKTAPISHVEDARAETPLGILNIIGAVSNQEYAAARRYARIVNRYRQVISSPNPNPPSIGGVFEPKHGGGGEIEDAVERTLEFDAVDEALSNAGHTSKNSVNRMAIFGEPCPVGTFPAMMRGLRKLTEYFDLTDRRKSELVGKAL
jgi:hypothetical protein